MKSFRRPALLAGMVISMAIGTSTPALAADRCDPEYLAHRAEVFAKLAERGIRVAGETGAGGFAEFSSALDAQRFGCP